MEGHWPLWFYFSLLTFWTKLAEQSVLTHLMRQWERNNLDGIRCKSPWIHVPQGLFLPAQEFSSVDAGGLVPNDFIFRHNFYLLNEKVYLYHYLYFVQQSTFLVKKLTHTTSFPFPAIHRLSQLLIL